ASRPGRRGADRARRAGAPRGTHAGAGPAQAQLQGPARTGATPRAHRATRGQGGRTHRGHARPGVLPARRRRHRGPRRRAGGRAGRAGFGLCSLGSAGGIMSEHDPRIDAYIAKAAPFAQPILEHIRAMVHEAIPDVGETIKWGAPTFMHAGGIVCIMAAFKQHAALNFWKGALLFDEPSAGGMGNCGKLVSVRDLPPKKTLLALLRKAARLNEEGVKAPAARKTGKPRPLPEVPTDLAAALKRSKGAAKHWDAFPPSHRREYIDWITEARRDE